MNSLKKVMLLLPLFLFLLTSATISQTDNTDKAGLPVTADYSGIWNIEFYDTGGKLAGTSNISIQSSMITGVANLNISDASYETDVTGTVSSTGVIQDGRITSVKVADAQGRFEGTLDQTSGSGTWDGYYNAGGTWKATKVGESKDDMKKDDMKKE